MALRKARAPARRDSSVGGAESGISVASAAAWSAAALLAAAGCYVVAVSLFSGKKGRKRLWRSMKRLVKVAKRAVGLSGKHRKSRVAAGELDEYSGSSDDSDSDASDIELPLELSELYEQGEVLGSGLTCTVIRATEIATGADVAIKCIAMESLPRKLRPYIHQEIEIMMDLDHPNIVKLHRVHEAYTDEGQMLYMVMERCSGGELFDRIVSKERYSEADARRVVLDLVHALMYLHDRAIMHRDIKPENMLLETDAEDTRTKLCDFGLAKRLSAPAGRSDAATTAMAAAVLNSSRSIASMKHTRTRCGTAHYVAPEVAAGDKYSYPRDYYSVGVLMYALLIGRSPPDFDEDAEDWASVTPAAQDLCRKLLEADPVKRATGQDVLRHEWIVGSVPAAPLLRSQKSIEEMNTARKVAAAAAVHKFVRVLKKKAAGRESVSGLPPSALTLTTSVSTPTTVSGPRTPLSGDAGASPAAGAGEDEAAAAAAAMPPPMGPIRKRSASSPGRPWRSGRRGTAPAGHLRTWTVEDARRASQTFSALSPTASAGRGDKSPGGATLGASDVSSSEDDSDGEE